MTDDPMQLSWNESALLYIIVLVKRKRPPNKTHFEVSQASRIHADEDLKFETGRSNLISIISWQNV